MAKYNLTLALVRDQQQILLINRLKQPFLGMWNGVGGKIESGETPIQGIKREIQEETGLTMDHYELSQNGLLKWHQNGTFVDGIYLFVANLKQPFPQNVYPQATREGILNPFPTAWVTNKNNVGIVADLKAALPSLLANEQTTYYTNFVNDELTDFYPLPA
ncbi:nucleotide NUDIX family hydrolase [Lactobacillus selangorensis]|uniref:Nucleotide NUDIX family hydrolase n=1 Tax=Lactobacillus selangorensis TaxID=81857 RepID=A0A0R2FJN9_9LACO|nr:NUDIX domain-containing protein [Lactobacillus selangorensis]KRN27915.1 nucleotide NUDIX family hydrolase [Lactobacillus selangorensis]KRN30614.1 nucleotide NUDIX family hydrolase [Lactobacillus selangorensis]